MIYFRNKIRKHCVIYSYFGYAAIIHQSLCCYVVTTSRLVFIKYVQYNVEGLQHRLTCTCCTGRGCAVQAEETDHHEDSQSPRESLLRKDDRGPKLFMSHFLNFLSALGRVFQIKFLSILGHNFFICPL